MGTTIEGERKMRERRIARRQPSNGEAMRDGASVAALATAVVLLVSIAADAHQVLQALAWIAFVAELVMWRIASRRLKASIERVPVGLPSWRREDARPVLVDL